MLEGLVEFFFGSGAGKLEGVHHLFNEMAFEAGKSTIFVDIIALEGVAGSQVADETGAGLKGAARHLGIDIAVADAVVVAQGAGLAGDKCEGILDIARGGKAADMMDGGVIEGQPVSEGFGLDL